MHGKEQIENACWHAMKVSPQPYATTPNSTQYATVQEQVVGINFQVCEVWSHVSTIEEQTESFQRD